MTDSFGFGTLVILLVIAAILVGVAVVLVRFRLIPPLNRSLREEVVRSGGGRLEVVESTVVDARRRLVLVRRDDVEHLLMIGGPADLVVENAVERHRVHSAPAAEAAHPALPNRMELSMDDLAAATPSPAPAAGTRAAEPIVKTGSEPRPRIEPKPVEARSALRPASGRSATPPRPGIAVVPGPVTPSDGKDGLASEGANAATPKNGASRPADVKKAAMEVPPSPPPAVATPAPTTEPTRRPVPQPSGRPVIPAKPQEAGASRMSKQRAEPPQGQSARLEPAAIQPGRRSQQAMPTPAVPNPPAAARDAGQSQESRQERWPNRPAAPTREAQKSVSLPPAEVPWPESNNVESEIGTALRADVEPPKQASSGAKPASRQEGPGRPTTNSPTTLGDLAERLEEALAREVHGADNHQPRPQYDLEAFGLAPEPPAARPPVNPAERPTAQNERNDRPEPAKLMAPAPEPEPRRDARPTPEAETKREGRTATERQEDAPVISLNARRPQAVDPLEDEMARLLGELTGDTNRR